MQITDGLLTAIKLAAVAITGFVSVFATIKWQVKKHGSDIASLGRVVESLKKTVATLDKCLVEKQIQFNHMDLNLNAITDKVNKLEKRLHMDEETLMSKEMHEEICGRNRAELKNIVHAAVSEMGGQLFSKIDKMGDAINDLAREVRNNNGTKA